MNLPASRRNKIKVICVMLVAVLIGSLGDICLSAGMKIVGAEECKGTLCMFRAAANLYVLLGIVFQLTFLMLYLVSLSWEDLSFVLPLTAADYILVTVFANFLLHEAVSPARWTGSALVAIGIGLVTRS